MQTEKGQLPEVAQIINTNFSKITIPFDSATEFLEIWVEWIAPFKIL